MNRKQKTVFWLGLIAFVLFGIMELSDPLSYRGNSHSHNHLLPVWIMVAVVTASLIYTLRGPEKPRKARAPIDWRKGLLRFATLLSVIAPALVVTINYDWAHEYVTEHTLTPLAGFRQQYPEYDDFSDYDLAKGLHAKFYSDLSFSDFCIRIGANRVKHLLEATPSGTPKLDTQLRGLEDLPKASFTELAKAILPCASALIAFPFLLVWTVYSILACILNGFFPKKPPQPSTD